MRVTTRFGITGPVPFLNVHVERDNMLFLDPSAIRNSTHPLALRAQSQLQSYFGEVLRCRASVSPLDQVNGLAILQELHEPNETRLGLSVKGVQGHGWGDEMGERLWDELGGNAACRAASLTRIEDLALFIDKVGDDLISDMTTRVVFDVLADFTKQMMTRYPVLAGAVAQVSARAWDAATLSWIDTSVALPDVSPHPLVLVPKNWVFWRMLMDYGAFYNRFSTTTVQDERATYDQRTGRRLVPSKKQLNNEFSDRKGLNNRQAAKNMDNSRDLVAEYRAEVDSDYEPLSDAEIESRTD